MDMNEHNNSNSHKIKAQSFLNLFLCCCSFKRDFPLYFVFIYTMYKRRLFVCETIEMQFFNERKPFNLKERIHKQQTNGNGFNWKRSFLRTFI